MARAVEGRGEGSASSGVGGDAGGGKGLATCEATFEQTLTFLYWLFQAACRRMEELKGGVSPQEDRCIPLIGKTCFNELRIPSDSFRMPRKLSQVERDDCRVRGLRGFCHRVVSICGRTTQPTQPAMRQRRQKGCSF